MKRLILAAFFLQMTVYLPAQLRLPAMISSHMVLQQQSTAKLWGWASPGSMVYITTSWDQKTDSVQTSRDANWEMNIHTPSAGGPYSIQFKSGKSIFLPSDSIELSDVMIGEVWVCSGQSNMELNELYGLPDAKAELLNCSNINIRFFYVPKTTSKYPLDNCDAAWTICDSNTMKVFSAAGYFFGKKLNKELNVPVGLINANWGGTPAEVWAPEQVVNNDPALKAAAVKHSVTEWWTTTPGYAYNAMIAPLTRLPIGGVIWYQGESNVGTAETYSKLFTGMIGAWRKAWNKDFPFYYVQIGPFKYDAKYEGALLQESQTQSMRYPNVGMVVITDLVDDTSDIHPKNKHEVGYRLANWALSETYHKQGFPHQSPLYKDMSIEKGKAIIRFDNAGGGLLAKDKKITELYLAGADKIFYPAEARIENDKLIVWSKSVKDPVAVRYAFGNTSIGNVFSKEGLPVTAFRTDSWQIDPSK
jgi:sialate O-acetylesterase